MNNKVCPNCESKKVKPIKNEVVVSDNFHKEREKWLADLWGCKDCGIKFVIGFAKEPFFRFEDD